MSETLFNLRHLRAFAAVAARGGVTAAAGAVPLSQPAITQAVAKLEMTLGTPLFHRRSTGMYLTEPGRLFRNRAERALGLIDEGAGRLRPPRARRTGFGHLVTSTQLRALLAVAQHGNFSMAARHLGVSQPSLHRLARDLERVSGTALYRRDAQGIALTDPARTFARFARLGFSELRQGVEEVASWQGIDRPRIAVGTLPLPRTLLLPEAINAIGAARPNVSIAVVDGPYDDLLHALRHGEIDLIVGALREPAPIEDVTQEELFRDRLAVFGGAGHPLIGGAPVTAGALCRYPWVVPRSGTPTRAQFDRLFAEAGVAPPERLVESSSLVLIRGLLQGSDRLTLISAHQVREEERLGLVKRLPVRLSDTERPIGLTTRRGWEPTRAQAEFLDRLREVAAGLR